MATAAEREQKVTNMVLEMFCNTYESQQEALEIAKAIRGYAANCMTDSDDLNETIVRGMIHVYDKGYEACAEDR